MKHLILTLLVVSLSTLLPAQTTAGGAIRGHVVDPSGAPIAGAVVTPKSPNAAGRLVPVALLDPIGVQLVLPDRLPMLLAGSIPTWNKQQSTLHTWICGLCLLARRDTTDTSLSISWQVL